MLGICPGMEVDDNISCVCKSLTYVATQWNAQMQIVNCGMHFHHSHVCYMHTQLIIVDFVIQIIRHLSEQGG